MKILAFVLALFVFGIGVAGIFVPACLVWIAEHSATPSAFYLIGAVRVAFGFLLIWMASASRSPRALRVLGVLILIAGISTAVTGLVAIECARAFIEEWLQLGSGVIRLTSVLLLALGGFVTYACAPARRSQEAPRT
jgi:hypothetical protein